MKFIQSIPVSLLAILGGIMFIPAIAYASFQYMYPAEPDTVVIRYGKLNMEWKKLTENDKFTEYLSKERYLDEDSLTVDILVMRNYQTPQSIIHENSKVVYSSVVTHQSVNCRKRSVYVQDMMLFSRGMSKGQLVKDLYDLDWDRGEARPGSIDEAKVITLCGFDS